METINPKGILILSPFFSPNIGGVETHLSDLVEALNQKQIPSFVHTYQPTSSNNNSISKEILGQSTIYRHYIFPKNIFHFLESYPFLDFLYLTPLLAFHTFIWSLFNFSKFSTIHSHGLNAAIVGHLISKLFSKKHIISIHAVYENLPSNLFQKIIVYILNQSDAILSLSQSSIKQLKKIGVNPNKLHHFTYWINTDIFKFNQQSRNTIRKELNIKDNEFTLLFVGRLIPKKAAHILCQISSKNKNIHSIIVGSGPELEKLQKVYKHNSNIHIIGNIDNNQLYRYYSASDLFCLPSQYPEGFGRVTCEALSCSTPVLVSDLGSAKEAMDGSVGFSITPNTDSFLKIIKLLTNNNSLYSKIKSNTRVFALTNFSSKNSLEIIKHYV